MAKHEIKSPYLWVIDSLYIPSMRGLFFFLFFWISVVLPLLHLTLLALFIWYMTLAASSERVCRGERDDTSVSKDTDILGKQAAPSLKPLKSNFIYWILLLQRQGNLWKEMLRNEHKKRTNY